MKFESFKAGTWVRRYQFKSFDPAPINQQWIWEDATINTLLESSNRALGELNAQAAKGRLYAFDRYIKLFLM